MKGVSRVPFQPVRYFSTSKLGIVSETSKFIQVASLRNASPNSVCVFQNGATGLVTELYNDGSSRVVPLRGFPLLNETVRVEENPIRIRADINLRGRVINPLGEPIDGLGPISFSSNSGLQNLFAQRSPAITAREKSSSSLPTNIPLIDTIYPIVRGHSHVLLGEMGTGKLELILRTLINSVKLSRMSKEKPHIQVLVLTGVSTSSIKSTLRILHAEGVLDSMIVVAAPSEDPVAMQFIAPFAGLAIAEFFSFRGYHSVLGVSDLSTHAAAAMQLHARDFNSPAHVHAHHEALLDRCAQFSASHHGGSLTGLFAYSTSSGGSSISAPSSDATVPSANFRMKEKRLSDSGSKSPKKNNNFESESSSRASSNRRVVYDGVDAAQISMDSIRLRQLQGHIASLADSVIPFSRAFKNDPMNASAFSVTPTSPTSNHLPSSSFSQVIAPIRIENIPSRTSHEAQGPTVAALTQRTIAVATELIHTARSILRAHEIGIAPEADTDEIMDYFLKMKLLLTPVPRLLDRARQDSSESPTRSTSDLQLLRLLEDQKTSKAGEAQVEEKKIASSPSSGWFDDAQNVSLTGAIRAARSAGHSASAMESRLDSNTQKKSFADEDVYFKALGIQKRDFSTFSRGFITSTQLQRPLSTASSRILSGSRTFSVLTPEEEAALIQSLDGENEDPSTVNSGPEPQEPSRSRSGVELKFREPTEANPPEQRFFMLDFVDIHPSAEMVRLSSPASSEEGSSSSQLGSDALTKGMDEKISVLDSFQVASTGNLAVRLFVLSYGYVQQIPFARIPQYIDELEHVLSLIPAPNVLKEKPHPKSIFDTPEVPDSEANRHYRNVLDFLLSYEEDKGLRHVPEASIRSGNVSLLDAFLRADALQNYGDISRMESVSDSLTKHSRIAVARALEMSKRVAIKTQERRQAQKEYIDERMPKGLFAGFQKKPVITLPDELDDEKNPVRAVVEREMLEEGENDVTILSLLRLDQGVEFNKLPIEWRYVHVSVAIFTYLFTNRH